MAKVSVLHTYYRKVLFWQKESLCHQHMAPSSIGTEELYVTKESDEVGVIIKLEKISIVVLSNLTTYSLEDFLKSW